MFVMFNKFTKIIRRLIRENFYLSNKRFQIWWLISGMEVMTKYKTLIQYPKIMTDVSKTHELGM